MLALVVTARFGRLMASILASRRKYPGAGRGHSDAKRAGSDAAELCDQPPMIPHSVEGYQVTTNTNPACSATVSKAIAPLARRVSVYSLYGQRRQSGRGSGSASLFCLQCHVPQADTAPIVGNTFTHQKVTGNKRLLWEILTVSLSD